MFKASLAALAALIGSMGVAPAATNESLRLGPRRASVPAPLPQDQSEILRLDELPSDAEVAALTERSTLGPGSDGPWVRVHHDEGLLGPMTPSAWMRLKGSWASLDGTENEASVEVSDLRLMLDASIAEIDLVFSAEAGETAADAPELADAHAHQELDAHHEWIFGQFRLPFLWSSMVAENRLLFPNRTLPGETFDLYEPGLGLRARYEWFDLLGALQNGVDGSEDSLRATARVSLHLVGGGVPFTEQSFGADEATRVSLAFGYSDDGEFDEGDAYAVELHASSDRTQLHVEWLDFGDDIGGNQPFVITASRGFSEDVLDVGVRYQYLDDPGDTWTMGLAASRYLLRDLLHWQASVEYAESDDMALDGLRAQVAIVLSL